VSLKRDDFFILTYTGNEVVSSAAVRV